MTSVTAQNGQCLAEGWGCQQETGTVSWVKAFSPSKMEHDLDRFGDLGIHGCVKTLGDFIS